MEMKFTWSRKKDSVSEVHPSAITNHVTNNNHTIDLEGVKLHSKDGDTSMRGDWEATAMWRTGAHTMNHDGGTTNFHMLHQNAVM